MNHGIEKMAIALILVMAAPQSFAWVMYGRVIIIGPLEARAITLVADPDHDANVMLTNAELYEAGVKVDEDNDVCVYNQFCRSRAKDSTVCSKTEYCGKGSASEGWIVLLGVPLPWTTRRWGGEGAGEVPECQISGGGGGGGNQKRPR